RAPARPDGRLAGERPRSPRRRDAGGLRVDLRGARRAARVDRHRVRRGCDAVTTMGVPTTNEEAWALASSWSTEREMTAFEALMWRMEIDARLRSPMTMVDLLDEAPEWERLRAAHDWGSRLIPRFRRRVQEPLLGLGS